MKELYKYAQFAGYLKEISELKKLKNGQKLICLEIITSSIIKKDGKLSKATECLKAIAWSETAEKINSEKLVNNIAKGCKIIVNGYIISSNCTDQPKQISEIMINSLLYRNIKHAVENNNKKCNTIEYK